jgi:hypothetical protein
MQAEKATNLVGDVDSGDSKINPHKIDIRELCHGQL